MGIRYTYFKPSRNGCDYFLTLDGETILKPAMANQAALTSLGVTMAFVDPAQLVLTRSPPCRAVTHDGFHLAADSASDERFGDIAIARSDPARAPRHLRIRPRPSAGVRHRLPEVGC